MSHWAREALTVESFNGSPINMVEMVGFEPTVPEGRVLQTLRLPATGYISEIWRGILGSNQ